MATTAGAEQAPRRTVRDQVVEFLAARAAVEETEINDDLLLAELDLGSVGTIEVDIDIESTLNVTITDPQWEQFVKVGDVIRFVEEHAPTN